MGFAPLYGNEPYVICYTCTNLNNDCTEKVLIVSIFWTLFTVLIILSRLTFFRFNWEEAIYNRCQRTFFSNLDETYEDQNHREVEMYLI